eukprot:6727205-Prymnesium_polylepis.1
MLRGGRTLVALVHADRVAGPIASRRAAPRGFRSLHNRDVLKGDVAGAAALRRPELDVAAERRVVNDAVPKRGVRHVGQVRVVTLQSA